MYCLKCIANGDFIVILVNRFSNLEPPLEYLFNLLQMENEIRRLNALNEENKELIQAMKKDAYRIQVFI